MVDCSVNFPVTGLITRLQELIGYRALHKAWQAQKYKCLQGHSIQENKRNGIFRQL